MFTNANATDQARFYRSVNDWMTAAQRWQRCASVSHHGLRSFISFEWPADRQPRHTADSWQVIFHSGLMSAMQGAAPDQSGSKALMKFGRGRRNQTPAIWMAGNSQEPSCRPTASAFAQGNLSTAGATALNETGENQDLPAIRF